MAKKTKGEARKLSLMITAERLIAEHGYASVTMRQIAKAAECDVALTYYHFKSKRDLFEQIFEYRTKPLNEIRLASLEALEARATDTPPSTAEILNAFSSPLLDMLVEQPETWRNFFILLAQVNNSPELGGDLMTKYFDPLVRRFIDALKKAMPDASPHDIYWSYQFFSGALTLIFASTERLLRLSDGKVDGHDIKEARDRLPGFMAAGFEFLRQKPR